MLSDHVFSTKYIYLFYQICISLGLHSNGDYGWVPNGGWYMKVHYKPGKNILISQSTCYNPMNYELQDCYRNFISSVKVNISLSYCTVLGLQQAPENSVLAPSVLVFYD